jgi:hypothetical protein
VVFSRGPDPVGFLPAVTTRKVLTGATLKNQDGEVYEDGSNGQKYEKTDFYPILDFPGFYFARFILPASGSFR